MKFSQLMVGSIMVATATASADLLQQHLSIAQIHSSTSEQGGFEFIAITNPDGVHDVDASMYSLCSNGICGQLTGTVEANSNMLSCHNHGPEQDVCASATGFSIKDSNTLHLKYGEEIVDTVELDTKEFVGTWFASLMSKDTMQALKEEQIDNGQTLISLDHADRKLGFFPELTSRALRTNLKTLDECAQVELEDEILRICGPKASCIDEPKGFSCTCKDGYRPVSDIGYGPGFYCVDINECAASPYPCLSDGTAFCVDWDPPVKFRCGCNAGYEGTNANAGGSCRVSDPCLAGTDNCSPDAICTSVGPSWTCKCRDGFLGNGINCAQAGADGTLPTLEPVTPAPTPSCVTNEERCDTTISTCAVIGEKMLCLCLPGYQSFSGVGGQCVDVNECLDPGLNNCDSDALCINTPGSFRCMCPTGLLDFPGSLKGQDCRTQAQIDIAINSVAPTPIIIPPTAAPSSARRLMKELDYEEDFFGDEVDTKDNCQCVDCVLDPKCGGLWKGSAVGGDAKFFQKVNVVVSHCKHSLAWLADYTSQYDAEITVISKCGVAPEGLPMGAMVVTAPNVGRNDEAYAKWITKELKDHGKISDNTAVVFIKDDMDATNVHQLGSQRSLSEMLRIASTAGFACAMESSVVNANKEWAQDGLFSISAYHNAKTLNAFSLDEYARASTKYGKADASDFKSTFKNFGEWAKSVGVVLPTDVVQVCYGGSFAVQGSSLNNQKVDTWEKMAQSLSRADNIEEGHFAERAWAGMLAKPVDSAQARGLKKHADAEFENDESYFGTLIRKVKGVVSVGFSSMPVSVDQVLKSDGYEFVGVTSACLSGTCAETATAFDAAAKTGESIVVSIENVEQSSNVALDLAKSWDSRFSPQVAVSYSRFYEWVGAAFLKARKTDGDIQFVDFLQIELSDLFDLGTSKVSPYRHLMGSVASYLGVASLMPIENAETMIDLVSMKDFSYYTAKSFEAQPIFENKVTIVNSQSSDPVVGLFCGALKESGVSCRSAKAESVLASFADAGTGSAEMDTIVFADIVAAAAKRGIYADAVELESRLVSGGYGVGDLPRKCLNEYELNLLLQVSKAFERSMMPGFFESIEGESNMESNFAELKSSFCSVDTDRVLVKSWSFLFD